VIIDSHVHVGSPPKEADPLNFIKLMKKNQLDKAVIFRYYYDKPTEFSNRYVSSIASKYPDWYIGFAWINPNQKKAETELETAILDWNLKGVKLHLEMHPTSIKKLEKIANVAEKYGIPICVHLGNDFDQIESLAKKYKTNIIIAHLGTGVYCLDINRLQKAIKIAKNKNVFLETSGNTYPLVDYAIKSLDSTKLILGSDFPHEHPLISKKIIEILEIPDKEKKLILYKNISKILKI